MLDWLESSAVARLIHETTWTYPLILSAHAVGMAVLVGIMLMINFCVLGFARDIPVAAMRPMLGIVLAALVISVVSGSMLFISNANAFFESGPLRVKALLLVVGGVLLWVASRQWPRTDQRVPARSKRSGARMLAALSVVVWIGVIVAGRLIAYFDTPYT